MGAKAITPTASCTAPTRIDKTAAFFIAHLVLEAITHAVITKSIIYGRRETSFVEGEKANFDVGLNCKTRQLELGRARPIDW